MSSPDNKPSFLKPVGPTELRIESHGFPIGSLRWFGGEVSVAWHAGPLTTLHTSLDLLREVVETGSHVQDVIASRGGQVLGNEHLVIRESNEPQSNG